MGVEFLSVKYIVISSKVTMSMCELVMSQCSY